ncbi:hypothetical protein KBY84_10185 [Cyanobium sp. N.Huapi 1H5]|nr:hypothetical protein [Cyanobium sp. N.Huapi 1H5]
MDAIPSCGAGQGPGPEQWYITAQVHFSAGRYREAILNLSRIRTVEAYAVRANSNIGSCLLMMQLIGPAMRFIDRSLQINPSYIPALLNRVKALQAQERHDDVQAVCQQILKDNPEEEEAWKHWVGSLHLTHQTQAALLLVKRWQERLPDSLQAHLLAGELLCQQGQYKEAIPCFGEVLRIAPNTEKAYAHLSGVMIKLRHHEVALKYIEKALSIHPESISYCCRKAQILWLMARWEEASDWFGKAYAMRPESATLFLNQHLTLPSIPRSSAEIDSARVTFVEGLKLAESNSSLKLDFLDEAIPHTFQLAYHNREDRDLLERYIDLMRCLAAPLLSTCRNEDDGSGANATRADRGRLRIGFLSRHFSGHSNALAFEGLIRFLDRQRFEVVLIHAAKAERDSVRDSLDAACDQTVQLSSDYVDSFKALRQLDLDILFFTDLGMNAYEYLLPFFRSAPIQVTGWGIPHTSGIREIDFYLSADKLEPAGSENSYTEKLIRLPGGLPCSFSVAGLGFTPLPREYFFLPPGATLLGCLQSLHKIHPDFDELLEQIAQRNPDVIFVFVEDPIEAKTAAFLERLSRTAPSVRDRCLTLALMTRGEYHALCHCIDLLLDPIYYGCGITFFEASFVGTPIITMEGHNLRSRVVSSGYQEMGLGEPPVATSPEHYVEITTQLINDRALRDRLSESILANNHHLFDRLDYIRNFEEFCLQAVRHQRHTQSDD